MKYLQTKHEKDSAKVTALVILILFLLIFIVGPKYIDPPEEYGVSINFASSELGEGKVQQNKPKEIEEVVEEELIEEETKVEEVIEEEQLEEEIAEEKVAEEIEEAKKEAEEAENLKKEKEKEAKEKAEAETKEKEAKEAKEAKERAEAKAAAAKAKAEAKMKAESEAKAAAQAAKKAREGTPFSLIENAPIYPGCEGQDNDARKKCMSAKIKTFITENFDTDLASDLTGIQKINISFKISTSGNVVSINAKASNPKLEAEAKRVTSLLPKMKPGMQQGKAVVVSYGLPIRITLED